MILSNPDVFRAFLETSKGYMMNTATAAVVDGKMEPMQAAPITQQLVITGQALYDTFVGDSQENVSKMDLIRGLVGKADALQIKGACDKLVEIAKGKDTAAGVPEKVLKDGKEVANRGPKTQSAMNTRTVIQQAWGALSFARDALDELGYRETTGYQDMRVIAKRALDAAKRDWKGDNLATSADRERRALLRAQKGIQQVFQDVQKETPMEVGETFGEWQARVTAIAADKAEEVREENLNKQIKAAIERLQKEFDENGLIMLTQTLLNELPVELSSTVTVPDEQPADRARLLHVADAVRAVEVEHA
jgi:hypothetical protein